MSIGHSSHSGKPTLDQVIRLEPRVRHLLAEAVCLARARASQRWRYYDQAKAKLSALVGWHSRHPVLADSRHYEVADQALCKALRI